MSSSRRSLLIILGVVLLGATLSLIFSGAFATSAPEGATPETGGSPRQAAHAEHPNGGQSSASGQAADATSQRTELAKDAKPKGPTFILRGVALRESGVDFVDAKVLAFAGKASTRRPSMANMFGALDGPSGNPREFLELRRKRGTAIATAEVQPDGAFVFEALPTRHVRLVFDHDHYALAQPEIVHIHAERASYVTLRPRLGGHIIGRVAGPKVDTPRKIRLTAEVDMMAMMRRPEDFMGTMMNAFSNRAEVDPNGRFEFRAVSPSNNIQLVLEGEEFAARYGPTPLRAGQTREVVIHPVRCGRLTAMVTGPDGKPIQKAQVRTQRKDIEGQQSKAFSTKSTVTGADGKGTIRGLLPGTYDVAILASGYVGTDREAVIQGSQTLTITAKLAQGGKVEGIVVDESGNPISGAGITYLKAMNIPVVGDIAEFTGEDILARGASRSETKTDEDGRFVLGGLVDEEAFSILAWHDDFGGGRAKDVRIGDKDVTVRLQRPARVTGTVVDDESGEPIQEFVVSTLVRMAMVMERATSRTPVEKSATGAFVLEGVRAGKSKLSIQAGGYADFTTSIELKPGQDLEVGELRIKRQSGVRGTVVDADGKAVAGATVSRKAKGMLDNPILRSMSGESSCTTDEKGHFELLGLRDGAIKLKATAPGHASGVSKRIRLHAGKVVEEVVLQLGRGGTVDGELLLPAGASTEGWLVTLSNNAGGSMQSSYVSFDGKFRFENVDPGRYDVQAMNERTMMALSGNKMTMFRSGQTQDIGKMITMAQEQIVRTKCRVKTGEVSEVTLDASEHGEDGVAVTFEVTLGDKPVKRGWMEIELLDSGEFTQAFLDKGRATMGNLRPGRIRVQVRTGLTMTPVGDPVVLEIPKGDRHVAKVALPGGGIRGTVVDQETGEPMHQAIVRIVSNRRSVNEDVDEIGFAVTNDKGEFEFTGLRDGTYSLFANESFFQRGSTAKSGRLEGIPIASDREPKAVTLRTRRASRASLIVDDVRGRNPRHALVYAVDEGGKPLSLLPARTDDQGRATVLGLPVGNIRLVVIARGLVPGFSDVQELLPARETMFRLTLNTGPRARLRIEDGAGQVLKSCKLSARWNGGPWLPLALVQRFDPQRGQFDIGHVAPGRVEFLVNPAGRAPFTVARDIPKGPAVELVFTAPK